MTPRRFVILLCAWVLLACQPNTPSDGASVDTLADAHQAAATGFNEREAESYDVLANYFDTPSATDSVTELTAACAIIVYPTDEQLAVLEANYGDDFATIADDATFYQGNARMLLDSLHVPIQQAKHAFIRLKGTAKTYMLNVRKPQAPEWNMFFFHPGKEPMVVSSIDVDRELIQHYFGLNHKP